MIPTLELLEASDLAGLDALHYECEVAYRGRIIATAKGSPERDRVFNEAYDSLVAILTERRNRRGRLMDALGLPPDTADGLAALLGPPPARIFDIGCGSGVLVEAMRERGYEAFGIDVSSSLIKLGRDRLARRTGGAFPADCLRVGDFLRDEPDAGRFDLVHSNDVLEHIHPDEAIDFLRRANTLLRPGGLLWLVTPNRWTGPGDATALRHPPGTQARGLHLREYTLSELVTLLGQSGFTRPRTRLWAAGRFRRASRARPFYASLKLAAEPLLAALPPSLRRRPMDILDYSLVIAAKPSAPRSPRAWEAT